MTLAGRPLYFATDGMGSLAVGENASSHGSYRLFGLVEVDSQARIYWKHHKGSVRMFIHRVCGSGYGYHAMVVKHVWEWTPDDDLLVWFVELKLEAG